MDTDRLLLIVEDDEAFARTLTRSFERRGYTVLHADGHVVMVWIDRATGRPTPLPDAVRNAIAG